MLISLSTLLKTKYSMKLIPKLHKAICLTANFLKQFQYLGGKVDSLARWQHRHPRGHFCPACLVTPQEHLGMNRKSLGINSLLCLLAYLQEFFYLFHPWLQSVLSTFPSWLFPAHSVWKLNKRSNIFALNNQIYHHLEKESCSIGSLIRTLVSHLSSQSLTNRIAEKIWRETSKLSNNKLLCHSVMITGSCTGSDKQSTSSTLVHPSDHPVGYFIKHYKQALRYGGWHLWRF